MSGILSVLVPIYMVVSILRKKIIKIFNLPLILVDE